MFQEKIFKNLQKKEVVGIYPPSSKNTKNRNKRKRKQKEGKRKIIFIVYIIFNINWWQGAETLCVCACTKRVCVKITEPKVSTVGLYSK